ncbi:MAG: hypothetical protein PHP69_07175, partial [Candidatus Omnitrophica bacterium]|nr:hypothetical protein [Candidatus Omnitrophota bacterium]
SEAIKHPDSEVSRLASEMFKNRESNETNNETGAVSSALSDNTKNFTFLFQKLVEKLLGFIREELDSLKDSLIILKDSLPDSYYESLTVFVRDIISVNIPDIEWDSVDKETSYAAFSGEVNSKLSPLLEGLNALLVVLIRETPSDNIRLKKILVSVSNDIEKTAIHIILSWYLSLFILYPDNLSEFLSWLDKKSGKKDVAPFVELLAQIRQEVRLGFSEGVTKYEIFISNKPDLFEDLCAVFKKYMDSSSSSAVLSQRYVPVRLTGADIKTFSGNRLWLRRSAGNDVVSSPLSLAQNNNTGHEIISRFLRETRGNPYLVPAAEDILYESVYKAFGPITGREGLELLDLMTGAKTYMSSELLVKRSVGVGLNRMELWTNLRRGTITSFVEQDLNQSPYFPEGWQGRFDAVLMTLGMAYLNEPVKVLVEAGRLLRDGGRILIAFNEDYYDECATDLWKNMDKDQRVKFTLQALSETFVFTNINAVRELYPIGRGEASLLKPMEIITAERMSRKSTASSAISDIFLKYTGLSADIDKKLAELSGANDELRVKLEDLWAREDERLKVGIIVEHNGEYIRIYNSDITDVEAIVDLYFDVYWPEEESLTNPNKPTRQIITRMTELLFEHNEGRIYIARKGEEAIGYLRAEYNPSNHNAVVQLAIKREYREHEPERMLTAVAISWLDRIAYEIAMIEEGMTFERAAIFESLGFRGKGNSHLLIKINKHNAVSSSISQEHISGIVDMINKYPYLADNPVALIQSLRFTNSGLFGFLDERLHLEMIRDIVDSLKPEDNKLRLLPEWQEKSIDTIVEERPGLFHFRPFLRELVRQYYYIINIKGKRGLEIGPGDEFCLFDYLTSLGAEMTGVDRQGPSFADRQNIIRGLSFSEYLEDNFKGEPFDFIYARRSIYFSGPSEKLNGNERIERIIKKYAPIVKHMREGAILITSVYQGSEEHDILSIREAKILGLELVVRYRTRAGFLQVVTVLRKADNEPEIFCISNSASAPVFSDARYSFKYKDISDTGWVEVSLTGRRGRIVNTDGILTAEQTRNLNSRMPHLPVVAIGARVINNLYLRLSANVMFDNTDDARQHLFYYYSDNNSGYLSVHHIFAEDAISFYNILRVDGLSALLFAVTQLDYYINCRHILDNDENEALEESIAWLTDKPIGFVRANMAVLSINNSNGIYPDENFFRKLRILEREKNRIRLFARATHRLTAYIKQLYSIYCKAISENDKKAQLDVLGAFISVRFNMDDCIDNLRAMLFGSDTRQEAFIRCLLLRAQTDIEEQRIRLESIFDMSEDAQLKVRIAVCFIETGYKVKEYLKALKILFDITYPILGITDRVSILESFLRYDVNRTCGIQRVVLQNYIRNITHRKKDKADEEDEAEIAVRTALLYFGDEQEVYLVRLYNIFQRADLYQRIAILRLLLEVYSTMIKENSDVLSDSGDSSGTRSSSPLDFSSYDITAIVKTILNKTSILFGGKRIFKLSCNEASSRLLSGVPFIGDRKKFVFELNELMSYLKEGMRVEDIVSEIDIWICAWIWKMYGLKICSLLEENYGSFGMNWDDRSGLIMGSVYFGFSINIASIKPDINDDGMVLIQTVAGSNMPVLEDVASYIATYILFNGYKDGMPSAQ